MIYKQLSHLPIIFQVDENIIYNTRDYLVRNKLMFHKILVVSGVSYSKDYALKLAEMNEWDSYTISDNDFQEIKRLIQHCEYLRYDLIIAIGGGKVLDTVKRVSYLTNINHLSIPTIISNDGLISPIAVIKNNLGTSESIPGMMPMGVIIDLDIIQRSPIDYLRAAAGDILSNISATNDWVLALRNNRDSINDLGFQLSRSAANALLYFEPVDLHSKAFLRMVIQGQINSGIAMSLAGTSRPCSGSEHLISHALVSMGVIKNVLHGIQVASISLFTLFLQGKLLALHIKYALATQIPLCFTELLQVQETDILSELYHNAKRMRPGRYTVLDEIDEKAFVQGVRDYKEYLHSIAVTV